MNFDLNNFRKKFLQEAKEKIEILTEGLLLVETQPENLDKLKELMRAAHTLKGSSKMMGINEVAEIAHSIEDKILDLIDGRADLKKEVITDILKEIDEIFSLLFKEGGKTVKKKLKKKTSITPKEEIKEKNTQILKTKTTSIPLVNYLKIDTKRIEGIVTNLESIFFDLSALSSIESIAESSYKDKIEKIKDNISLVLNNLNNIRLLPLSLIFEPQIRNIRDLSIELKKDVRLKIEGGELLVEKRIIDSLSEPLVHLIRNAIDHGIESPEERVKKGKNTKGMIFLRGYQKKDKVFIEIEDDGRGIEWDKIKEKAIEKGLISINQKVKSKDLFKIITSSGFSTKDKITNVSGRGIGMDIVFDIVQKLNGKLFVASKKDKGTKFIITLPKNLSLIKALIVRIGKYKFAIPLSNIEKIIKKGKAEFMNKNDKAYLFYFGDSLPIIDTTIIFGELDNNPKFFLIIRDEYEKAALLVDEIISYENLIIKDSGVSLKKYEHILGNSIIGSGEIITVFDPESLIELTEDRISVDSLQPENRKRERRKILVLEDSELTREIIVNSLVAKNFIVQGVENGIKGLEELKTFSPDLIITDIDMPEMDGITFFRAMKTMDYKTPVLFLSSRDEDKEIKEVLKLGALGFIKKSEFTPEKIKILIDQRLKNGKD
jgi:two-component system chemotaxis sensor kinase CheA